MDEILSIEMRLATDKALAQYNTFATRLKKDAVSVPLNFEFNTLKIIADAQQKFRKHRPRVDLDTTAAQAALDKLAQKHIEIKAKVALDDSVLSTISQRVEALNTVVKLNVAVDSDRLSTLQADLDKLTARTFNIDSGTSFTSITKDVKAVLGELDKLTNKVVGITVNRTGEDTLADILSELNAIDGRSINVRLNVEGDSLPKLESTLADLKSKASLSLIVDVRGDSLKTLTEALTTLRIKDAIDLEINVKGEIERLLTNLDLIRTKILQLDVDLKADAANKLFDNIDALRKGAVNLAFTADTSGLKDVFDRLDALKAAARDGLIVPVLADDGDMIDLVARIDRLRSSKINIAVNIEKLDDVMNDIHQRFNSEKFLIKVGIDPDSMAAMQAAKVSDDEADRARIKRKALLERLENTNTQKELQQFAKQLSIMPTNGTSVQAYKEMLAAFLALEESADRVYAAWRITGQKFENIQDEMKAKAIHVGKAIFEAENHGAADLVRFAWDRTGKTFGQIQNKMVMQAEQAGKRIADALDKASKHADFKLDVDSKKARKDLADFQNYAKLSIANDLEFNINTAKAQYDIKALQKSLKELKEDKGSDNEDVIKHIRRQIDAYNDLVKAAKDEATTRSKALQQQSASFKILIAEQEALEEATKQTTAEAAGQIKEQEKLTKEAALQRARVLQAAQRESIKDILANKDNKVNDDGSIGIAGLGNNLSKVEKLQERLEAVQRTLRDLRQAKIDLIIDDNLPAFKDALRKLEKEQVKIKAQLDVELDDKKNGWRDKLKGGLRSIGSEFMQVLNLDLQSVVSGLLQGYRALGGGLLGLAKDSLKEFGAIEGAAQRTAALLDGTGRGNAQTIKDLRDTIAKVSVSPTNLFSGQDIGKAADNLARAGASIGYIKANLGDIATTATRSAEDIGKVGNTTLAFANKFADVSDTAIDRYNKQQTAVKAVGFALTNAKISADNFLKTVQYSNPVSRTAQSMRELTADTVAFARIGVIGSKTGTNINSVFKSLAETLDGTSKKADDNRAALDAIEASIGKIDYSKFKDENGNIKESGDAIGELTRIYVAYEKAVGSSKAAAVYQKIFGVQGLNALKNGVAVLGEVRAQVLKELDAIVDGTNTTFTERFDQAMKMGWDAGLKRLENLRDSYRNAIGAAIAPVATGMVTLLNSVLEKSFALGPTTGLAAQIKRIQNIFTEFGKNETVVNNLAIAFNRVSSAVGEKLLALVERLMGYLSDDKKVMDLANGISFWITTIIDAFTTATEVFVGLGVAAAKVGAAMNKAQFKPLDKDQSELLNSALSKADKLSTSLLELENKRDAYAEAIKEMRAQLDDETNATKLSTEERQKLSDKLKEAEAIQTDIIGKIRKQSDELKHQKSIIDKINEAASKPDTRAKNTDALSQALGRLGDTLRWLGDIKISDDMKLLWDKLLSPTFAMIIDSQTALLFAWGVAIKAVAVPVGLLAGGVKNLTDITALATDPLDRYVAHLTNSKNGMLEISGLLPGIAGGLAGTGIAAKAMGTDWSAVMETAKNKTTELGQWVARNATDMLTTQIQKNSEILNSAKQTTDAVQVFWNTQKDRFISNAQDAAINAQAKYQEIAAAAQRAAVSVQNVWQNTMNYFAKLFSYAQGVVNQAMQNIWANIQAVAANIGRAFAAGWEQAGRSASVIGSYLQQALGNAFGNIQNAMGALIDWFQNAWRGATDYVGQLISGMVQQARNIPVVGGLIPGFASGGVIAGPVSKVDNVIIAARTGEGILVPEAVKAMGGAAGLERINRRAEAGTLGFASGGVVSPLSTLTAPTTKAGVDAKKQVSVVSTNPPAINAAIVNTAKATQQATQLAKAAVATEQAYWDKSLAYLNAIHVGEKSIHTALKYIYDRMAAWIERVSASGGTGMFIGGGAPTYSIDAPAQEIGPRLVGYTGKTGRGTGPHLHIQFAGDAKGGQNKDRALTKAELARFVVGGQALDKVAPTSDFGHRDAPTAGASTFHGGIDYGFADGTPIVTNSPVKSRKVWEDPGGGGIVTDVEFEDGLKVRILHSNPKTKDIQGLGQVMGGAKRPAAPGASLQYGMGLLSRADVDAMMQGGTNSMIAKVIGMAEGNRTASGAYTKYASGHKDPGNGKWNIGSFSAQGTLNDGTIAGSDQRVIDRLLKPRIGELFDAAVKAGVIVTPQLLFNYLDLANQAPEAAMGWNDGRTKGVGFLGKLAQLKGKETDVNAIANLRVEGYRNTSGRLETTFASQAALLKDQQRRMGELTDAISAFKVAGKPGNVDAYVPAATPSTSILPAQENLNAAIAKLNAADRALVEAVQQGDPAKAANDLSARLEAINKERQVLIDSVKVKDPKAPTKAEDEANKRARERLKELDKRKSSLQEVINAQNKINNAQTQVALRKQEEAYNDEMAALNAQARAIGGDKESVKESAKLRELLRQRDEAQREVNVAKKRKVDELANFDRDAAENMQRLRSRKGVTAAEIAAKEENNRLDRLLKIDKLDEAITEAYFAVTTQDNKLEDFYRLNALDDRADKLAEIIALQKRIREKTIDRQELSAALTRLGIANINGQFTVDKALLNGLSDISGKIEKASDRSQGQIEKLLRGQGVIFKDALFEQLDLEYNYYQQKRDSELDKATAEQLSFLYSKGLLKTGSFVGGSYVVGSEGNARTRLGELSLESEERLRKRRLDEISRLHMLGKYTDTEAKALVESVGGNVEVIRAGVNPNLKQATGKRLTTVDTVPYVTAAELNTAIAENNTRLQQITPVQALTPAAQPNLVQPATGGLLTDALPSGASRYMENIGTQGAFRIKLDLPAGTDERITAVVRQVEEGLNSDAYTRQIISQVIGMLKTDPQLARHVFY